MSEVKSTPASVTNVGQARRLRLAAILVIIGVAIELVSLRWAHPTAFLVFAGGTGACLSAALVLFLVSLFRTGPTQTP